MKLRELFELDTDFKERMFAKQMAVLKGQAFNVVETLKCPDLGPLELTRRPRVHVWVYLLDHNFHFAKPLINISHVG